MKLLFQAFIKFFGGAVVIALLLFLPAGTLIRVTMSNRIQAMMAGVAIRRLYTDVLLRSIKYQCPIIGKNPPNKTTTVDGT